MTATPSALTTIVEVYHNSKFNEWGWEGTGVDPEDLMHVATIEFFVPHETTRALEIAFRHTNHVENSWIERPIEDIYFGVTPKVTEGRSTSMGDVMKLGNEWFVVAAVGFKKLKFVAEEE